MLKPIATDEFNKHITNHIACYYHRYYWLASHGSKHFYIEPTVFTIVDQIMRLIVLILLGNPSNPWLSKLFFVLLMTLIPILRWNIINNKVSFSK